jgi:hypothetical protein
MSWYSAHSSDLSSALSQCPQYSSIASGGATPTDICTSGAGAGLTSVVAGTTAGAGTTGGAETTAAAGTSGAAGTTGSTTSSGASTSATGNAAHKESGFVGAAVAAAGFLGVIAAL